MLAPLLLVGAGIGRYPKVAPEDMLGEQLPDFNPVKYRATLVAAILKGTTVQFPLVVCRMMLLWLPVATSEEVEMFLGFVAMFRCSLQMLCSLNSFEFFSVFPSHFTLFEREEFELKLFSARNT